MRQNEEVTTDESPSAQFIRAISEFLDSPQELAQFQEIKDDWLRDLNDLVAKVREWADERGWTIEAGGKTITEEAIGGSYNAPMLRMNASQGQLVLEPIALFVIGAAGRVDLFAWPTHYRVMLLRRVEDGHTTWTIRTDSGINWPQRWNKKTFLDIADRLLNAE